MLCRRTTRVTATWTTTRRPTTTSRRTRRLLILTRVAAPSTDSMWISRPCAANSNTNADTDTVADPRLLALRCPQPILVLLVALLPFTLLWSLLSSLQRSFIILFIHRSIVHPFISHFARSQPAALSSDRRKPFYS